MHQEIQCTESLDIKELKDPLHFSKFKNLLKSIQKIKVTKLHI